MQNILNTGIRVLVQATLADTGEEIPAKLEESKDEEVQLPEISYLTRETIREKLDDWVAGLSPDR